MAEFGLVEFDDKLLKRFEAVSAPTPLHPLLKRGLVTHHRDLDLILKDIEEKRPIYIYTGRGPSSSSMHLGHLVPFMFTQYLQKAFGAQVVIQITDDEKFLFRNIDLDQVNANAIENIKDIMSCGFDQSRTFVFKNTDYIQQLYPNVLRIQSKITNSQCFSTFGIQMVSNIGQTAFCAVQAAPAFSSSFPTLFDTPNIRSLIPCGLDQDPYFRLTRDVAPRLGYLKPSLICSGFLPSLRGVGEKMSSTVPESAIFLTDTDQEIASKIRKSFSGGRVDKNDQMTNGADLDVDVAYQYLKCFLEDDNELEQITRYYGPDPNYRPKMLSRQIKKRSIEVVTDIIHKLRENRT